MSEIIELATRLGKAIAESQQAKLLREASKAMDAEPATVQLLNDYRTQAQKLDQMEHENKPIEVEDKHKLQDLHDRLVASEIFKKFTAAQMEYVDLMRQVNSTLHKQLAEVEKT